MARQTEAETLSKIQGQTVTPMGTLSVPRIDPTELARKRALKNQAPKGPLTPGLFAFQDPTKTSANDLVNTGTGLRDFFSRLLTFSIGPSVASRGVPPGTAPKTPMNLFSPVRL